MLKFLPKLEKSLKKTYAIMPIVLVLGIGMGFSIDVSGDEQLVPSWIKNTAGFWVDGKVSDYEFVNAVKFLINQGTIKAPSLVTPTLIKHDYSTFYSYDNYRIKYPDDKFSFIENENASVLLMNTDDLLTEPPLSFPEYLSVNIVHTSLYVDDYVSALKTHLEETSTDFVILNEGFVKYGNTALDHYGNKGNVDYKIIYQEKKGKYTLINTVYLINTWHFDKKTVINDDMYIISHQIISNKTSSIDMDYVIDTFAIGTENSVGNGVEFLFDSEGN